MWWIVGAVVWVLFWLIVFNRKHLTKAIDIALAVGMYLLAVAIAVAIVAGVFMFIPYHLFGDAGLALSMASMFIIILYAMFYEDYQDHWKSAKGVMMIFTVVAPVLYVLFKIG